MSLEKPFNTDLNVEREASSKHKNLILAGLAAFTLAPDVANSQENYHQAFLDQMQPVETVTDTNKLENIESLKMIEAEQLKALTDMSAEFFFTRAEAFKSLVESGADKSELQSYKAEVEAFELEILNAFFAFRQINAVTEGLSQDINDIAQSISSVGEIALIFNFSACQKAAIDRALINNTSLEDCPQLDFERLKTEIE